MQSPNVMYKNTPWEMFPQFNLDVTHIQSRYFRNGVYVQLGQCIASQVRKALVSYELNARFTTM